VKPDVELGALLGGTYRIVRRIGSGGMGEVYEATHDRLAHRYAVKFLHPGVRDHPEALPRFMREAQITSRLRHPGIVSVVDFNTLPDGVAYLVMEYLEGESLGKLLARTGPLPIARVVDITEQISSALTAAHLQGVVHRDMHPQNVFVVPGTEGQSARIKILDFGISKIASISQRITGMAAVMGTPQYMSPEQAEGKIDELDAASDQFSLAAIVYELLGGRPAFAGETLASIAYQIVHAAPPSLRGIRPELSAEMENVVLRGLAKNKKDRFPSVSEFATHLRWTAKLRGGDAAATLDEDDATPMALTSDTEETTAVSALPSGMAAVLRETTGLPARSDSPAPAAAPTRRNVEPATDDELTVVRIPDNELSALRVADSELVAGPPPVRHVDAPPSRVSHVEPTFVDLPRNRGPLIAALVAVCVAAVAVIGGFAWRARAPRPDGAGAPAAATNQQAAQQPSSDDKQPAADPPASRPASPAAHSTAPPSPGPDEERADPSEPPPEPDVAAASATGERRAPTRTRSRTAAAHAAPKEAAATDDPEPAPALRAGGAQCRLSVGTYPWSELWVDGADTGQQTPVVGLALACGPHRLQFKRRDLHIDQTENVTLIEGHDFKRQYDLRGAGVDD
jgi:serine/threonine protein kinase